MMTMRFVVVLLAASLGACGGTEVACDKVQVYQRAELTPKVEAPEGMDQLDPNREMPMPQASPRPPREPGSPCVDRPPEIKIGS
jgi:uncharacterized lipoprotein